MKIAFVSNFFNHHQKYLSDCLYREVEGNYRFIATMPMASEQKKLGYTQFENIPYIINAFENDELRNKAIAYLQEADVIISGSVVKEVISKRAFKGKINFKYAERPLKNGNELLKYIPRWIKWHLELSDISDTYMLCASAFTAADFSKFGLYRNKTMKWGYFPETRKYDKHNLIANKKDSSILWCGRMLDWKHPDDAIKAAKRLKDDGYKFILNIIGDGQMRDTLEKLIDQYELGTFVNLLGSKPSAEVRRYMEESQVYLFTSDRYEGWGAVLNEAMNSGCAVVASHAIGSVPYLIKSGDNGLVYHSGNVEELYASIKKLLDNNELRDNLGRNAYNTIINLWNSDVAAKQFVNIARQLIEDGRISSLPTDGPCSVADIMQEEWFDEK